MDIIKASIEKDGNTVKIIKLIRGFDSSFSMGEIKEHMVRSFLPMRCYLF